MPGTHQSAVCMAPVKCMYGSRDELDIHGFRPLLKILDYPARSELRPIRICWIWGRQQPFESCPGRPWFKSCACLQFQDFLQLPWIVLKKYSCPVIQIITDANKLYRVLPLLFLNFEWLSMVWKDLVYWQLLLDFTVDGVTNPILLYIPGADRYSSKFRSDLHWSTEVPKPVYVLRSTDNINMV